MRQTGRMLRMTGLAACAAALALTASCRPAGRGPADVSARPLPLKVEVLPSKRIYRLGEKILIRVRLVNPTAKPVTVTVFEGHLNGRANWWPKGWAEMTGDEYPLPDGTTRTALREIPLPPLDDRAEFVTVGPRAAYEERHSMVARVPGKWNYRVCFFVQRNRIYAGAYNLPPLVSKASDLDLVEKFWSEWHARGYVRSDEAPYLVMKVNPDVTLGTARPVKARIEVRDK